MNGNFITNCSTGLLAPHTKQGVCSMFEGTPYGLLISYPDFSVDISTITVANSLENMLQAAVSDVDFSKRIFPIYHNMVDMQVSGGDVRTNQEGFAGEQPDGINNLRKTFVFIGGGICLYKQLRKFDEMQVRVFGVDNKGNIEGTIDADGKSFKGYSATIKVTRRLNTGSQKGAVIIDLFFGDVYEQELTNSHTMPIKRDIDGLKGITFEVVSSVNKIVVVKVIEACSGLDITSLVAPAILTEWSVVLCKTSNSNTYSPFAAVSFDALKGVITLSTSTNNVSAGLIKFAPIDVLSMFISGVEGEDPVLIP